MSRLFFFTGSVLAGMAVAIGAYGSHSNIFDEVQSLWIDKGVRYQMYHALALLCTSLLIASQKKAAKTAILAGFSFLGGIILFSGSLYFMAISSIDPGYVTPLGGVLFLVGWFFLAINVPGVAKK